MFRMGRQCHKTRPQSGQALLEYIMLLIIGILIIGGVLYQFNDAFKQYASQLMVGEGSYFGCLIREGVLPGGANCEEYKPTFSLKNGKRKFAESPPYDPSHSPS